MVNDTNRDAATSVKGIDGVDKGSTHRVLFCQVIDSQQVTFSATFKGVNHPKGQGIVDIISHVGVKE